MKTIKQILVVMDPMCEQQPALTRAISLAKLTTASIELFLVAYNRQLVNHWTIEVEQLALLQKEYVASQLRWLETYESDVINQGLNVKTDITWHKDIATAVLDKISQMNPDIVIKSTHQHPSLNRLLFTPTDWRLLQHCHVPLLLAKLSIDAQKSSFYQVSDYKVIMAAVDPINSNEKPISLDNTIIDASVEFSSIFSADIHVAHCYQPVGMELWHGMSAVGMDQSLPMTDFNEYQKSVENYHRSSFDELMKDYSFDNSSLHLVSGNVEFELTKLAQENQVDLLVMGMGDNVGFIGNTVEKILDNVCCDILSIKIE
jgi:universal stress protein E